MKDKLQAIKKLVEKFQKNEAEYSSKAAQYNETEVRVDFINEFFEILGWDIRNKAMLPKPMREVVAEVNIIDESSNRKPDYEFRINTERKFFVEAKKPSVDVTLENEPAYQTRRYGWSATLTVSILTNFKDLIIYDCSIVPYEGDNPRIAKARHYSYKDYVQKFDEIYSLLSKEAVAKGSLEATFGKDFKPNKIPFDSYFLDQIEKWRKLLAEDIVKSNSYEDEETLNQIVQIFINRLIFLRICEDRSLEKYGDLKNLPIEDALKNLLTLFYKADKKYDSGLFDFIHDTLTPRIKVSDSTIINIVNDFYYPNSPYTFTVVDPKILGDIYEQFLSRKIFINDKKVVIKQKPEAKAANGVYTTPKFIVDFILNSTLQIELQNKDKIDQITLMDIACGSGIFLVEAYTALLNNYLKKYIDEEQYDKLRKDDSGDFQLTLAERKSILLKHIYGVDIDTNATEVTKFSLLVKILEDITEGEIEVMVQKGERALPNLENNIKTGNSLIDEHYFEHKKIKDISVHDLKKINPFNFKENFPEIFNGENPGFSIIVGNPPYIKIQKMVSYSPEEVKYYHCPVSKYLSAKHNNFDKYMLFVERSIELLRSNGMLGYITPHKFMTIQAGEPIRALISENHYLKRIVHFGIEQVFGNQATTYTNILVLQKSTQDKFEFQGVVNLKEWKLDNEKNFRLIESSSLSEKPWSFDNTGIDVSSSHFDGDILGNIAEIFVGLQTSADDIFIVEPMSEENDLITFKGVDGKKWTIEASITQNAILDYRIDYFSSILPNRKIIFPYANVDGKNTLILEDEFIRVFPKAYEYLNHYKKALRKRHFSNSNSIWYQYGRSQSLQKFNSEKLIIKNPASSSCIVLDKDDVMFTGGGNGPYYGIRSLSKEISNTFLLGLINSNLFDTWVKARSSVFRGGYYSFGKQFITDFPIPKITKEVKGVIKEVNVLWNQINDLNIKHKETPVSDQETLKRKQKLLKEKSDQLIEKLYKRT